MAIKISTIGTDTNYWVINFKNAFFPYCMNVCFFLSVFVKVLFLLSLSSIIGIYCRMQLCYYAIYPDSNSILK